MELSLGNYSMTSVPPSQLASAALALSMRLLDPMSGQLWSGTLCHYTRYTLPELQPTIRQLASLLVTAPQAKLGTVYQKYSNKKFMKIAR